MKTCRVVLLLFDLQSLSKLYGLNWLGHRSLSALNKAYVASNLFFSQSLCQSSKPKLEMLARLNAAIVTFPKNINKTNNLPCHNT